MTIAILVLLVLLSVCAIEYGSQKQNDVWLYVGIAGLFGSFVGGMLIPV